MSLDSLAPRVAKHDKVAFEDLYNKLRQAVYSACLGVVKSHALAEELTQDTFVTVWLQSDKFRGIGYKTWILTIAKNKSLNLLKKRARELSVDFTENDILGSYESDIELSVLIKNALKILDPIERQIVLLRASGVKAKELALYLKMPRGTVSWKHTEAIKKLKKYMEGTE
ncbi:MAG: RNA polymerase sigma factor [Clostridia bacterium]|nr:RNA polymerase sigma factor [Clostridia bacterium]